MEEEERKGRNTERKSDGALLTTSSSKVSKFKDSGGTF
jgi:hypothetical protein